MLLSALHDLIPPNHLRAIRMPQPSCVTMTRLRHSSGIGTLGCSGGKHPVRPAIEKGRHGQAGSNEIRKPLNVLQAFVIQWIELNRARDPLGGNGLNRSSPLIYQRNLDCGHCQLLL
jgi:hypothetical protein